MQPLVTLIVPGRDIATFAPAAIASLQAQSETRWRAVLIDDGSRDDTGAVFADAAVSDPRFEVIRHEESVGLGAARNVGLTRVDTPYLGFMDADDELTPNALSLWLTALEESGSDFAVGAYARSREIDGRYLSGRVQPWVAQATSPRRLATTLERHPAASANIVAWSKLSRTDFWAGRRFPENVAYEDQIVAQQMYTEARTFDVIPDIVAHWRVRADGTSITQGKNRVPVLVDYLTALRGGIRVLHEAGATAAVICRLELILAMDLPPLRHIAETHPDPSYAAALDAFEFELRSLPEFTDSDPDPTLRDALTW